MNDLPIIGTSRNAPKMTKPRVLKGEECGNAKLTEEKVRQIRNAIKFRQCLDELRKHYTNEAIAKRLGVSPRTVERIIKGETWGHVE